MEKSKVYYTRAQQDAMLVSANTEVIIGSRRSGKSHSRVAPTFIRNAFAMPRSCGGFVASTFKQAHKRTVPAMMVGLDALGYKRDIHYIIGRRPPKKLGWARPLVEPDDWHDVISFFNGSIMTILSQDVNMSANSMTLDYVIGDEARGLDFQKLKDDVFPANGGTTRYFGECPWHHGLLFVSDMPVGKQGSWILDYRDKCDPELIEMIRALMAEKYLMLKGERGGNTDNAYKPVEMEGLLRDFRRRAVYYAEWSIFENIELIGLDYVRKMKRDLPPLIFQTSILCRRLDTLKGGFYPNFKQDIHCYVANNNKPLENEDWGVDGDYACLLDADLDLNAPIAVAFDYNANINWLVAGQVKGQKMMVLKSFFVKYQRKLREVIDDFCNYYRYMHTKTVVYYYDSTALGSNYAVSDSDFFNVAVEQFNRNGWEVTPIYLGSPMAHKDKYLMLNDGFKGAKGLLPMFNSENNEALIISILSADVSIGSRGFQKDKGGEKLAENEEDLLEYRTDGSDAFDVLYIGCSKFPYADSVYMGSCS